MSTFNWITFDIGTGFGLCVTSLKFVVKYGIKLNDCLTVGSLVLIAYTNPYMYSTALKSLGVFSVLKYFHYGPNISKNKIFLQSLNVLEYSLYWMLYHYYNQLIGSDERIFLWICLHHEQFRLILNVGCDIMGSLAVVLVKKYLGVNVVNVLSSLPTADLISGIMNIIEGKGFTITHNGHVISSILPRPVISEQDLDILMPINDRLNPQSEQFETPECAICWNKYTPEIQLTRTLKCKHSFHCGCVDTWFFAGHRDCPVCRTKVIE